MLLAANFLSPRIPAAALAVAACAAVAIQGLGKALAPLWLVFWFMVVCYFVGGAGHGVKNVAFRSLIHERVPSDRHGRAFAAYNGLRNSAELVALAAGGALVAALGARGTLVIAGGVSAAGRARRARRAAPPDVRRACARRITGSVSDVDTLARNHVDLLPAGRPREEARARAAAARQARHRRHVARHPRRSRRSRCSECARSRTRGTSAS